MRSPAATEAVAAVGAAIDSAPGQAAIAFVEDAIKPELAKAQEIVETLSGTVLRHVVEITTAAQPAVLPSVPSEDVEVEKSDH